MDWNFPRHKVGDTIDLFPKLEILSATLQVIGHALLSTNFNILQPHLLHDPELGGSNPSKGGGFFNF